MTFTFDLLTSTYQDRPQLSRGTCEPNLNFMRLFLSSIKYTRGADSPRLECRWADR